MSDFWLHPSLLLLVGAAALPLLPRAVKKPWLLLVPILVFARVATMSKGVFGTVEFLEWTLVFGRVDALSTVFAYIMSLMGLIGTLYALRVKEDHEHIAAWTYVSGSLGVIFAGDLLTLFLFWELMAFSSVFLIWARRTPASLRSGFRYLLVHTTGGLSLLAGIVLFGMARSGDFTFSQFDVDNPTLAAWMILGGFILNAAVPPLHAWLPDSYAEGTFSGSVFLSAFTTKTAVYALCRGFPGMDILVVLGVIMAVYGVVYAVLENDCRRLLAYHIISQVGYMVAGVGLGTQMAVNGTVAHAFAHILYKGLLFMGCGSVLFMTGQSKLTELGGLYKKMPWTFVFTLIGGLSISAFPLFSGFVSKSIIVASSFEEHKLWAAFFLMLASVGTFLHTGLKVPYFIWFGKNNCREETWNRAEDPGWNMTAAMVIASVLCVFIGCFPGFLYRMLPYPIDYVPYTSYHISETLLLLLFTGVGFFVFLKKLVPTPTISIDLDWPYRMAGRAFYWIARKPVQAVDEAWGEIYRVGGIAGLMRSALAVKGFDNRVIDGIVDGIGSTVRRTGTRLRKVQRGSLQENLTFAFVAVAAVLVVAFFILSKANQ